MWFTYRHITALCNINPENVYVKKQQLYKILGINKLTHLGTAPGALKIREPYDLLFLERTVCRFIVLFYVHETIILRIGSVTLKV